MGAAKAVLEWVTVPVLAIALGLPHGALVYWLSSSTFSVCQARYVGWTSVPDERLSVLVISCLSLFTVGRTP